MNPQNVLEQAKRYSAGAFQGPGDWNALKVPFLYATNGEIIWHLDARPDKRVSRRISNFHTAPALGAFFATNLQPSRDWLLDTPPDTIARLRDYQRRCIIAVEAAIIDARRELLVAAATGTGKTFLTVAQIYRLLESKFARRILFLVDRKALAAQAVREFASFNTPQGNKFIQEYEVYSQRFQHDDFGDDAPFDPKVIPNEYLTSPKPAHTFVYVSTIQRMARNLFGAAGAFAQTAGDAEGEDDADTLDIPIHAFDLSIDEEDFDSQPLLTGRGGKSRTFSEAEFKKVFHAVEEDIIALNWHDSIFSGVAENLRKYPRVARNFPAFFGAFVAAMRTDLIIRLGRIYDGEGTGHPSCTLARCLNLLRDSPHFFTDRAITARLREDYRNANSDYLAEHRVDQVQVAADLGRIKQSRKRLIKLRHKEYAHKDVETVLTGKGDGFLSSHGEIKELIRLAHEIWNRSPIHRWAICMNGMSPDRDERNPPRHAARALALRGFEGWILGSRASAGGATHRCGKTW